MIISINFKLYGIYQIVLYYFKTYRFACIDKITKLYF